MNVCKSMGFTYRIELPHGKPNNEASFDEMEKWFDSRNLKFGLDYYWLLARPLSKEVAFYFKTNTIAQEFKLKFC